MARHPKNVESYQHDDSRLNNPPSDTKLDGGDTRQYRHPPRTDPYLSWSGKVERDDLEVDTIPIGIQSRFDPYTIIRHMTRGATDDLTNYFEEKRLPPDQSIRYYEHEMAWANRMIAGDSLLVMNSLLTKENMAETVQMAYIDPPFSEDYKANYQPTIDSSSGNDKEPPSKPAPLTAFRDTWELGVHSYLSYLRDRILLCRKMLKSTGSLFIQISDANVHRIRILLDEIFGSENFVAHIVYRTAGGTTSNLIQSPYDYILWYAKDKEQIKMHKLYKKRTPEQTSIFNKMELRDGTITPVPNSGVVPKGVRRFCTQPAHSQHKSPIRSGSLVLGGRTYNIPEGNQWRFSEDGMRRLYDIGRLHITQSNVRTKLYHDDFPYVEIANVWEGTMISGRKEYAVQTSAKPIQDCMLMTTDPGDLVFDPTCGSGTTAYVAEQWGRRWITCDVAAVAIAVAMRRLCLSTYKYYKMAKETIRGGFDYKTVKNRTMKSLAYGNPPEKVVLYDQSAVLRNTVRVSGPFTAESISHQGAEDTRVDRPGSPEEYVAALKDAGIHDSLGTHTRLDRLEHKPGKKYAIGKTGARDVMVWFGPKERAMDTVDVAAAVRERASSIYRNHLLVLAAFEFTPKVGNYIRDDDTMIKVSMGRDMLVTDLKNRPSDQLFKMDGQPDISIEPHGDEYVVRINGFDYYNPATDTVRHGGPDNIMCWILDTNHDNEAVVPDQIFFPSGASKYLDKLNNALGRLVDPINLRRHRGMVSEPFRPGSHRNIAVRIIDQWGVGVVDTYHIP